MIEFVSHAFVWLVSPMIVLGTAAYALIRSEFLLGALGSLGAVFICALIAMKIFDGHLLAYNWIYGLLLAVPAMLSVLASISGARHVLNFVVQHYQKASGSNDVQ